MKLAVICALLFTSLLWDIKLIEMMFGFDWSSLGIYPRRFSGLVGLFFSPLLHSSFEHLMANTPAVIVLLTIALYSYPKSAKLVIPILYVGTGACVWLFARDSYHLGASGLTFGLMFYIFVIGVLRRDKQSIGWSLIVFFLYGSMLGGLLPEDKTISYESHIAGACLGIALAFMLKNKDPELPRKIYSWELEDEEDEWHDDNYEESSLEHDANIRYEPDKSRTLH